MTDSNKLPRTLNETEDIRNCRRMSPARVEEVRRNKGKCYQVAECLILRQDIFQVEPSVGPQIIRGGQLST